MPWWPHSNPEPAMPSRGSWDDQRNPKWTACIMRHRDPRRALSGALLCGKHERDLLEDLRDLTDLYPLLDHVLEPGSVQADELVRYGRQVDPPAAARLDVVALRDQRTTWDPGADPDAVDILGVLGGWARILREERQLADPDTATVTSEAAALRTHHEWIITQPWVDEYATEVHRAALAVRHACGEYERSDRVGTCTIPTDDGTCGGPLYPDRYGLMRVRCARCGETWDEDDLRRLGLILDSDTPRDGTGA